MKALRGYIAFFIAACLVIYCVPVLGEDFSAGTITMGYTAAGGAKLNPFLCNERDLVSVGSLVYESLFELDENMKPQPVLAEAWAVNGKTWTVRVRSGVMFHNGIELVAQDVAESYKLFANTDSSNPYHGRLDLIESVTATDTFMLEIKAKYPGMIGMYALTFPIVQRDTVASDLPMGTGPYWLIQYEPDSYIHLDANPLWWKRQPVIKTVVFRHFWDTAQALEALRTGEIDMFQTRSASASLTKKLNHTTSIDYTTFTYELLVPRMSGVMGDINLRKAVMYAIDYNRLITNGYLDMAQQSEVPIPPGSWLYESRSAVYYYSPERAMQYMLDSGWADLTGDAMLNKVENGMLKYIDVDIITYNEPSSNIRGNVAGQIAENLRSVGVNAKVETMTRSKLQDRMKEGEYDLALIAVNLSEAPNLLPLLTKGGAVNFTKTDSEEIDELLKGTLTAVSEEEMKNSYASLETYIVDNLPIMGLCFRTGMVLSTRNTAGLTAAREGDAYSGLEFLK